jgi:hypothetical protein
MAELKQRKNKSHIDYSSGKIYQIISNLPELVGKCLYIGSTVSLLVKRWGGHKTKAKAYPDRLLYGLINKHGGFNNFQIVLMNLYPCASKDELQREEQKYITELKPICNMINTITTFDMFIKEKEDTKAYQQHHKPVQTYCKVCDKNVMYYTAHCKTLVHIQNLPQEVVPIEPKIKLYKCEICNIELARYKGRHNYTTKHKTNLDSYLLKEEFIRLAAIGDAY